MTVCCALMACKKISVDFSYSPTEPRAGEAVAFTNLSSSGEDWSWSFGDGSVSTLRSPSHTYKKPGTYKVVLKVDNKNRLTATKELTVYDTIPTFVASDSVFYIYEDYTFTANVYNPYNYEVTYEWIVNEEIIGTESTMTCYFTLPEDSVQVQLNLTINGVLFEIVKRFYIEDVDTRSVYFRTDEADYRQRIFGERAEEAMEDETAALLLDLEQDTMQTYNGYDFKLSELAIVFPGIEGFKIANRKIYFRLNGLWVANIDGANIVAIDESNCTAMTIDPEDSRIYWANENGVWYMPFIGSDNNKFITVPTLLNELNNVTKIAVDL